MGITPLGNRLTTCALALILLAFPGYSLAQNPYATAVTVNDASITNFEINQRALMLKAIGTLGDLQKQATDALIEDRLRQQSARALGLTLTEDEKATGMTEFAKRANMTSEQFVAALAPEGVYPETFYDFINAGLIWRKVVETKFQSKAFITESELNTAMELGTTAVGASVLVSELILPLPQGAEAQSIELATELSKRLKTFKGFEEAVLTYSAAASRGKGGKLDWMPITNLPPDIAKQMMTMSVGEVTAPVQMPQAVAIFQLRGIRDNRTIAAKTIAYDYAKLLIPGGQSDAARQQAVKLSGEIDTCQDLAAKAQQYPAELFSQQVTPIGKTPRNIAGELANLDTNEVSLNLTEGKDNQYLVFLMLCGRTNKLSEGNREQVRQALFGQRMEAFGQGYLQELMGDATIVRK